MAIEKRRRADGRVVWRARVALPGGRERCRTFDRKADASRWWDQQRADLARGTWVDPRSARITVGVMAETWLATKINLKASTRESYAGVLRSRVLPRWGDRPLPAVGHADVAGWLAELSAQGPSAARVRACFLALSSPLDLAVRDGRLTDNPAATGCFVQ